MTIEKETTLPCAGVIEGDGCDVFERYYLNESLHLESYREGDDHVADQETAELASLLNSPGELRAALHRRFIEAGFCVLALERQKSAKRPENVVSITRKRDMQNLQFAGCHFAQLADIT